MHACNQHILILVEQNVFLRLAALSDASCLSRPHDHDTCHSILQRLADISQVPPMQCSLSQLLLDALSTVLLAFPRKVEWDGCMLL